MKAKNIFGMGLNKAEKKGRRKIMKNKMKKTNLSTVVNVSTKILKKQKPLDIMSSIKVARKSIYQSMGSKKNVKIPRVINVPKIGGFLPIVPILTPLSAVGSLASGSAAIAKTIYNARMVKEGMKEMKRHNRKIDSVNEGGGLYLKPYRKTYGFFLKPYSKEKEIKKRKN